MAGPAYSAGTIFLQVVPSYRGVQDDIGEFARQTQRALEDEVDKGSRRAGKRAASILGEEMEKGGKKAGSDYAGAFTEQFRTSLRSLERELKPIALRMDDRQARDRVDSLVKRIETLRKTRVGIDIDAREALDEIAQISAATKALEGKTLDIDLDVRKALAGAKALDTFIEKMDPKVKVDVDTKEAERKLGGFEKTLRKRLDSAIGVLGESGRKGLDDLQRRLASFRDKKIGIDVGADSVLEDLTEIEAQLAAMANNRDIEMDVRIDSAAAVAELQALRILVRDLDNNKIDIDIDKDGNLRRLGNNAADGANSFRAFNAVVLAAVTLGPALIPILAGIAGGLGAIAVAAGGAVAGLGVAVLGFSGIGDAVSALGERTESAAEDTRKAAETMAAAAQRVEDAQRSLARAQRDAAQARQDAQRSLARAESAAAQAAEDAQQRIADAQRQGTQAILRAVEQREAAQQRLADTQRRAAKAMEDALERQARAEERLADAQRRATQAQEDLREARRRAQRELDDIADRQRQNAVDERQAVIDLFNAQVQDTAARQDPGATNLEKEQASINLEQAKIRLKEIRDAQAEIAREKRQADREGISGTDTVQRAEDNLTQALRAQRDAREALRDASNEIAETETTNARNIQRAQEALGDAQQGIAQARVEAARDVAAAEEAARRSARASAQSVADAQRNLSRVELSGRESVADAQRGLTRAQAAYQDALYETSVVGSTSMQKVEEAMGKLSPAGRRFALFLHGLRDEFYQLRAAAQEGMLPGIQQGLENLISTYGPAFTGFIGRMASAIGQLAVAFSEDLTGNPVWQEFFSTFSDLAPEFLSEFGQAMIAWMRAFAAWAIAIAPFAERMSDALLGMANRAADWMASAEGQDAWTRFMEYVFEVGPRVLDFFGSLWDALSNIAEALAPFGELVMEAVTALLDFIGALPPEVLGNIAFGILALVAAFQIANGIIAVVMFSMTAFSSILVGSVLVPLGPIIVGIVAVVAALILLYTRSETARKIIDKVFDAIGKAANWLFDNVLLPYFRAAREVWAAVFRAMKWTWENVLWPVLKAIGRVIGWLWEKVFKPVFGFIIGLYISVFKGMRWAWNNILWPVYKTLGKIVWELWKLYFKTVFDLIGKGWNALAKGMRWVWRNILKPVFDFLMDVIGDKVVKAFEDGIALIKDNWQKLKNIAKAPVRFVINTVMNKGIIGGFNWLARKFGMDEVDPIKLPEGFAKGGIYPGYTPGRDIGYIGVSGGEAIMRPEWTKVVGPEFVNNANRAAREGGIDGVRKMMSQMAFRGGFAKGGIVNPVNAPWSGKWGRYNSGGIHNALDFPVPIGTPVRAAATGRVTAAASWNHSYGHHIRVSHGNGLESIYAHLNKLLVKVGDVVTRAEVIGRSGNTGNSTGPHLHFEMRRDGHAFNFTDMLGKPGDPGSLAGYGQKVLDAISSPWRWLKDRVTGFTDKLTDKFDGEFAQSLTKLPRNAYEAVVDKIKTMLGNIKDRVVGDADAIAPAATGLQNLAKQMALQQYAWTGENWNDLKWLVQRESSWNPTAANPTSTAYGLFQFLDATWGAYGGKKTNDPAEQIRLGLRYISERYGSPSRARAFHEANGWYSQGGVVPDTFAGDSAGVPDNGTMMYDSGGYLPPGLTTVLNLTGKPEPVFTSEQFEAMRGGRGGITVDVDMHGTDVTGHDVAEEVLFALRRAEHGGAYSGGGR